MSLQYVMCIFTKKINLWKIFNIKFKKGKLDLTPSKFPVDLIWPTIDFIDPLLFVREMPVPKKCLKSRIVIYY